MVDAISIEVLCHLAETANPPRAAVFEHSIPVVGGKSPVLSVSRECIGWSTGLSVQVKVLRLYPSLYAIATDTDRDITLQYHTLLASIGMGGTHLLVEVELYIVPEGHLFI